MASELNVGKVKAADAELNATDYHLKLQDGAGNPWYLRAPDGSLRVHLNGTGDVLNFDSTGLATFSAGIVCSSMPTSDPSVAGQLWNDSGTVKISAG